MVLRDRYSPFNLTAFNKRLDHGLLLGLTGQGVGGGADDHGLGSNDSPTFVGLTLSGLTPTAVPFIGASDELTENVTSLFWDNSALKLEIYRDNAAVTSQFNITQDGLGDASMRFLIVAESAFMLGINSLNSNKFTLSGSASLLNLDKLYEADRATSDHDFYTETTGTFTINWSSDGRTTDRVWQIVDAEGGARDTYYSNTAGLWHYGQGILLYVDSLPIRFGAGGSGVASGDAEIKYNGTDFLIVPDLLGTGGVRILTFIEGNAAKWYLDADQHDDAGDSWEHKVVDGGVYTLGNDIAVKNTYVPHITITPNATVASSTVALPGILTVAAGLTIPSGTTPSPNTEGSLFLDTDAGANGTLVMYSNGAWRTVQAF